MTISERNVIRFIEFLKQPRYVNLWASPDAIRAAMKYAFDVGRGLDGKYECDMRGCIARVEAAGELCSRCIADVSP